MFAAGLAVTAALYYWTDVSRVLLFWAAFILTRPLGATLGDFLDKPLDHGGLALQSPDRVDHPRRHHDRMRFGAASESRHDRRGSGCAALTK